MRRNVGLVFVIGVVLPLALSASARAQGSTLLLSTQVASPSQVVTVTGGSFDGGEGAPPVELRFDTRDAPFILQTNPPGSSGQISATFPIPAGTSPGWHLLLATQERVVGRARAFTPARTRIRIVASGGSGGVPTGGSPGGGPPIAPIAIGLALMLLAAGSALTARRLRTPNRPLGSKPDAQLSR